MLTPTQQSATKQLLRRLSPQRADAVPARFVLRRESEDVELMQLFKEELQYNQTLKLLNEQYLKKVFGNECELVLTDRDYKDVQKLIDCFQYIQKQQQKFFAAFKKYVVGGDGSNNPEETLTQLQECIVKNSLAYYGQYQQSLIVLSQIFESPQYSQIRAQLQVVQQQTTQNMISQAGLDKTNARAVFQIGSEENGIFSLLIS